MPNSGTVPLNDCAPSKDVAGSDRHFRRQRTRLGSRRARLDTEEGGCNARSIFQRPLFARFSLEIESPVQQERAQRVSAHDVVRRLAITMYFSVLVAALYNGSYKIFNSSGRLHAFWPRALLTFVCMVGLAVYFALSTNSKSRRKASAVGRTAIPQEQQSSNSARVLHRMVSRQDNQDVADGFEDAALEVRWQDENYIKNLKAGAVKLHFITLCFVAYSTVRNILAPNCVSGDFQKGSGVFSWSTRPIAVVELLEYLFLVGMLWLTRSCKERPSNVKYWTAFCLYCLYIPTRNLPPMQWGCANLAAKACRDESFWYIREAVHYWDCSLCGVTATLMLMTWVLLLPWLIPRLQLMHVMWFWLLGLLLWSILYEYYVFHPQVFAIGDYAGRFVMLVVSLATSITKKFYLEKGERKKWLSHIQKREAGEKMFHVFEYMVPAHMVLPMLKNPGQAIAEPVEKVSIMFVLITEFDTFALNYTPKELLGFLNDYFTRMDDICLMFGVTKIETVGEEYVACVGVVPDDLQDSQRHGHSKILGRLFKAGDAILKLQDREVKFKIGIHTGPIVAGVVGRKLPRYRLFGDTINTAARMMQKGLPGSLQFGEATFEELPTSVTYKSRGLVEMKGKGMVKAYLFDQLQTSNGVLSGGREKKTSISQELISTASFSSGAAQETNKCGAVNELYEEALDTVGESDTSKTLFGWGDGFTAQMEKDWFAWYHREIFTKKFELRLTRFIFLLLYITLFDMLCLVCIQAFSNDERTWPTYYRWAKYFASRAASLAVAGRWKWLYAKQSHWINNAPFPVQFGILVSTCFYLVMIFVSYNLLTIHASRSRQEDEFDHPPHDEIFLPAFVLAYYYIMRHHALPFLPSTVFVGLACLLMLIVGSFSLGGTLYLSMSGKVLFIITSVIGVRVAYEEDSVSRASFRAKEAMEETQERTEQILNTLMPPLVVEQLRRLEVPEHLPSHQFKYATVAQSDLCGFTKLASTRTPYEVVDFISDLFGQFDVLTDRYRIYKVETIGDAYIAGQAEEPLTKENKPVNVVLFALEMVSAVQAWSKQLGGDPVNCRVGIHHGECIGGIVGTDMQRYHLFGGLMTGLEVLESTSKEGLVQLSPACKDAVSQSMLEEGVSCLSFELRSDSDLRTSKGEAHSYDEVGGVTYFVHAQASELNAVV